jgi:hypothetical protein
MRPTRKAPAMLDCLSSVTGREQVACSTFQAGAT